MLAPDVFIQQTEHWQTVLFAGQLWHLTLPAVLLFLFSLFSVLLILLLLLCCCTYVAQLQGSSVAMALLSSVPPYNDKISVMANMAPVVFPDFFLAPFLRLGSATYFDQVSGRILRGALQARCCRLKSRFC